MSPTHNPSLLPPITGVRVRATRRGGPNAEVGGEAAQRIAELWRALPPGRQARCHYPVYGFRFTTPTGVVSEATVCWRCNNIRGMAGGEPFGYEFDGGAPASLALLAEARRVVGDSEDDAAGVTAVTPADPKRDS